MVTIKARPKMIVGGESHDRKKQWNKWVVKCFLNLVTLGLFSLQSSFAHFILRFPHKNKKMNSLHCTILLHSTIASV